MLDDEFTTVNYLKSTESPPSWSNLCQNSSEKVTDEQYNLTRIWYEGEKATHERLDKEPIPTYEESEEMRETSIENEKPKTYEESEEMRETSTENEKPKISFTTPTVSNNNKEMREPHIPKSSLSDKMREKLQTKIQVIQNLPNRNRL